MALQEVIQLGTTGGFETYAPITESTGVIDGGQFVATSLDTGKLDESLLPDGIGADIQVALAYENIGAGDFVNLFRDTDNVLKVRKADASFGFAKQAHGYSKLGVSIGSNVSVYLTGFNTQCSGLTAGQYYFLSATQPGAYTTSMPPTGNGFIRQKLGYAVNSTTMCVVITEPIKLN